MKSTWFFIACGSCSCFIFQRDRCLFSGSTRPAISPRPPDTIEVECNIADLNLYLCPEIDYVNEEQKTFFGLISDIHR